MSNSVIHQAINFRREIGGGMSKPCVFECSDGVERLLKFQDRVGTGALASDWVGALLAGELDVQSPAPALVYLDDDAISTMEPQAAAEARPGYAFGTAYLPSAQNVIGIESITRCRNHPEILGRLAVLDTWIGTADRVRPAGDWNLLVETDQDPPFLVAIDFGMAFTGVLTPLVGPVDEPQLPFVCHPTVRPSVNGDAVAEALAQAEGITDAAIVKMVRTTPEAWLSDEQRGRVVRFLLTRRGKLRAAVAELEVGG